jgi:uncharacterized protein
MFTEMPYLPVAVVLSLAIGVVLGMLGGGGAMLTLPMLVYLMDVEPKAAIASSLLVVGTTSLVGMTLHARAGVVRFRQGSFFAVAAMAGSFTGARSAAFVPSPVLLVFFGVVLVSSALAMMRVKKDGIRPPGSVRMVHLLGLGVAVGLLSGLVGAGGGFLIVPVLTLFGGLSTRESIGTSLLIIALQSLAGFLGHVTRVTLDWPLLLSISGAAVMGSIFGAALSTRVAPAKLRTAFAWLVLGMGLLVFFKELPLVAAVVAGATTLTLVGLQSGVQISSFIFPKKDEP